MNDTAVWAAAGDFDTDPARARELAWIATGGQTGIVGPESLRVVRSPAPDGNVRILPGGFAIAATPEHLFMSTGYTSAPWQSYMRAIYDTQVVPIRSTGSSGGRVDTVGIVIDDPQYEGTSDSVDWNSHQFWRVHVIENAPVGSTRPHHFGSLGRPFMPLAQLQIPANKTVVDEETLIRDLRFMAVERERTREYSEPANPGSGNLEIPSGHTDWFSFPEIGGVAVPQWATHLQVKAHLTSLRVQGGTASGFMRAQFTADTGWQSTEPTIIRASGTFDQLSFMTVGRIPLDYDSRNTGRDGRIRLQIRRTSGGGGRIVIPSFDAHSSQMDVRAIFEEAPRSSAGS